MSATIVISWPFHGAKAPERHEVVGGTCLAEALMAISPDRWGGQTFDLYRGAAREEARVPPALAPDVILADDEIWHVHVLPAEVISGAIVTALVAAGASAAVASIVAYAVMTAISLAISFAVNMLLAPARQADRATSPADSPSAVNALTPPRNSMRAGARIPEIYGRMRIWPDLLFPAWSSYEPIHNWTMDDFRAGGGDGSGSVADNILGGMLRPDGYIGAGANNDAATAEQEVVAVYCLGRGMLVTEDGKFGDSPVGMVRGEVTWYPPGQTLPDWVRLPRPVAAFSRMEFPGGRADDPFLPWMDIPGDAVSEIWIQVGLPGGLYLSVFGAHVDPNQSTQRNVIHVRFQGERRDVNGALLETRDDTYELKGQTKNELKKTWRLPVNPGRWRVRVAEVSTLADGMQGYQSTRKSFLEGVTGFERLAPEHRTYTDETIMIVRCFSQGGPSLQNLENFNTIVTRYLPVLADPSGNLLDIGFGEWWQAAAIHTLTDPQICNYRQDQVDWYSVIEVMQTLNNIDEWRFSGIFDRAMSAEEQLQAIARKARAYVFISNGKVTFARDMRRPGVSALFNRRNRMIDKDSTGLGLRFPGPDENDAVEISWLDAANGWAQRTYTYPENFTAVNPLKVDLVGATHWHEVYRRARYEFALMRYRRRTQPLRVTDEGQLLTPFDRVSIVAPWDEGVIAGEIVGRVSDQIWEVDIALPILPVTPIRLRAPDGRSTFSTYCQSHESWPRNHLGIDSAGQPFETVVPSADIQLGTLFNISTADAYEKATQWLVAGVELDDQTVTLSLMEDDDRVYQESDDAPIPPAPPILTTY